MEEDEKRLLEKPHASYRVYPQRWYVLLVFSLLELHQNLVWTAFGPIALAAKKAYGWSDATLATFLNWGCIAFVFCLAPLTRYLDTSGLRRATLLVAACVAAGSAVRLLPGPNDESSFLFAAHVGAALNGVAGVTLGSAPTYVSACWFAENERVFATSVTTGFQLIGCGFAFYLGPRFVPMHGLESLHNSANGSTVAKASEEALVAELRGLIQNYLHFMAFVSFALLLVVYLYFPARPPSPPGPPPPEPPSSVDDHGWSAVLSCKPLWLVASSYCIPSGMLITWQSLMALIFAPLGVSDTDTGNIGFVSLFVQAGVASGVAYGLDGRGAGSLRKALIIFQTLAAVCYLWLAALCLKIIPLDSLGQLYIATVAGVTLSYVCVPLSYEYAVAVARDATGASEAHVGGFMSASINASTGFLLLLFFLPGIGDDPSWMNYGLVATTLLAVPLLAMTKPPRVEIVPVAAAKLA